MASRQSRNNVLAGSLVLFALVAAVIIVGLLGGVREQFGRAQYTVFFPLSSGVQGLGQGSLVTVGGKEAGVVKAVDFRYDESGNVDGHTAVIALDRGIVLRRLPQSSTPEPIGGGAEPVTSPTVVRTAPLLGTQAGLNFVHIGPIDGEAIEAGATFEASEPPGILASLGLGPTVQEVNATVRSYRLDESNPLYNDLQAGVANVRQVTERVKEMVDTVQFEDDYGRVREVIARMDRSVAQLEEVVGSGPEIVENVQGRIDQVQRILQTIQDEYLDAFRPTIATTLDNTEQLSTRANDFAERFSSDYEEFVRVAMEDARQALRTARHTVEDVQVQVATADPEIRQLLGSLRLGADQLRDTMIEVRRSPWRLLYRPSDQESEYELLYDSARLYAQSVSDLRSAVTALESVRASAEAGRAQLDPERVQTLTESIGAAFDRYQKAEAVFLERLTGEAPE